jgi:hypothetical protein
MVEVPSGRPSTTWAQLSVDKPELTNDWDAMKSYRDAMSIRIH